MIFRDDDVFDLKSAQEVCGERDIAGDAERIDGAAREDAVSESQLIGALGNGDGKRVVIGAAVCKRFVADRLHGCGNDHFGELLAVLECACAELGDIASVGKGQDFDVFTAVERICAHRHGAQTDAVACKGDFGDGSACKGEVADARNACGDVQRARERAAEEGACRDRSDGRGEDVVRSALGGGEVDERSAAVGEQHAVVGGVHGGGVVRNVDAFKCGAAEEGVGRILCQLVERFKGAVALDVFLKGNVLKSCGKGNGGEELTVFEGSLADGERGLPETRLFEHDGGEVCAVCERLSFDGGYACGDDDLFDHASRECGAGDDIHAVGDAVGARLGRGDIGGAHGVRRIRAAAVKEHAVLRGVAGRRCACRVDIDGFECGAARKCRCRCDLFDRIGQVDFLETCAVRKGAARDLRDFRTVVGGGHGDGGNQIDTGARAHRIAVSDGGVSENCIHPEGVDGDPVLRDIPGCDGIAVSIRVSDARAVGGAVPAAERARCVIRLRHGKREVFAVADGVRRESVGAAVVNGVRLGLIVSIEDKFACADKEFVGISCAVAFGTVGRRVPCDELIACLGGGFGKDDAVADCLVDGLDCTAAAAVKGDGVRIDAHRSPFGGVTLARKAHFDGIEPFLCKGGKLILCNAVFDGDERGIVAVHADLVLLCACDGLPAEDAAVIDHGGIERVVAEGEHIAQRRGVSLDDLELQGVIRSVRPGKEVGQIIGGRACVHGDLVAVHDKEVICIRFRLCPGERHVFKTEVCGKGGRCLVKGQLRRGRGVESLCDGRHGNRIAARGERFEREGRLEHGVDVVADLYAVGSCTGDAVPGEDVVRDGEVFRACKVALKDERCLGGSVSVCNGLDGEADSARLHLAVREVVVEGSSVVECGVRMRLIAAVDGDEIFLCILDAAEHKDARLNDAKIGNSCECVIDIVAHGGIGDGASACVDGSDFHAVRTRFVKGDGEGRAGRALIGVKCRSVGRGHRDEICRRTDRFPADRLLRDADGGSGVFRILRLPDGEQRRVRVEQRAFRRRRGLFIAVGETLAIVLHAHPPAGKAIAFPCGGRCGQIEFSSDRLTVGNFFAVIAEIVGDGVLGLAGRRLCPACIQRKISRNGLCAEQIGGGELCIRIPAEEYISFARRIGNRLGDRFPVENADCLHFAPARRIKRDRKIELFQKAHLYVLIRERDDVIAQCGGQSLGIGLRESKRLPVKRVGSAYGFIVQHERERASLTKRDQGLRVAVCVVVIIDADFVAGLGSRLIVACRQQCCGQETTDHADGGK